MANYILHTLDYRAGKVFIKMSGCRMPEKRAEKERWILAGCTHRGALATHLRSQDGLHVPDL